MTGLDPLAEWTPEDYPVPTVASRDYADGANDRLDALRPLIAAADALAAVLLGPQPMRQYIDDLAMTVRDLTTPKGDTP